MTRRDTETLAVLFVLVLIVLLPIGWILIAFPAEPYHVLTGEHVREAAQAADVRVAHVTDITWSLPGSLGGKSYVLEDHAGNTLVIQTQAFDSVESRDAAVLTFSAQSIGKGRTIGTLMVIGDQVVHIMPESGGLFSRLAPELKKRRAAG